MTPLRITTGWPPPPLQPNARAHWRAKNKAVQSAKREAFYSTYAIAPAGWARGVERFAVRIHAQPAVGRVRDKDNLVAASKAFLDGIAAALGVNDATFETPVVEWGERHRPGGRLIFEIEAVEQISTPTPDGITLPFLAPGGGAAKHGRGTATVPRFQVTGASDPRVHSYRG